MPSVPLFLLFLCPSVSTVPLCLLSLCSSLPTVSLCLLLLCSHCSSVPLFIYFHCSSLLSVFTVPQCPLFLCFCLLFPQPSVPRCFHVMIHDFSVPGICVMINDFGARYMRDNPIFLANQEVEALSYFTSSLIILLCNH